MQTLTCAVCGETLVVGLDTGSADDETPREHHARTGHNPRKQETETRACEDCGNVWPYSGDADLPTCPNCKGKRTTAVESETNND